MKFTILGAGWLGLKLAKDLKNDYKIIVSSRNKEKSKIYEDEGFSSYILNEDNFDYLDKLLDTDFLFINYPPSKFNNYLKFLEKIYSNEKISNIKKIIFISSTSIYPNINGIFSENSKIENSSSKIVFEAENLVKQKSNIIFRVSGLVGENRYFGKRSINKEVQFPLTPINFVHRDDIINATKFILENDIYGIFNLCSKIHPTKKEIYSFNAKKYGFVMPILSSNEAFINRIIDGSKIENLGFSYKYENPYF